MRKILFGLLVVLLFSVSACKPNDQNMQEKNKIKVGTIEGPETTLMEVAKDVAKKKYDLDIEIVTFSDYNTPNAALNDGSIDANMFQHQPYLDAAIKAHHFNIVSVGRTYIYPMGAYSKKIKSISELANNAIVAIPNDPSNEARALLLLEKAHLIKLKRSTFDVTPLDISSNPKHLQFKEIDAAQLVRSLDDVDLAVINTNYAMTVDLLPSRDALILEDSNSPYANLVVVREADKNDPRFKELVDALHSPEVEEKARQLFREQVIPAWK